MNFLAYFGPVRNEPNSKGHLFTGLQNAMRGNLGATQIAKKGALFTS
jgi:hypothetical protein